MGEGLLRMPKSKFLSRRNMNVGFSVCMAGPSAPAIAPVQLREALDWEPLVRLNVYRSFGVHVKGYADYLVLATLLRMLQRGLEGSMAAQPLGCPRFVEQALTMIYVSFLCASFFVSLPFV